jgi:hypothetical protein
MNVKIDKKDFELISRIARKRGEGTADFVRLSLRKEIARLGFLSKDETKALGVSI